MTLFLQRCFLLAVLLLAALLCLLFLPLTLNQQLQAIGGLGLIAALISYYLKKRFVAKRQAWQQSPWYNLIRQLPQHYYRQPIIVTCSCLEQPLVLLFRSHSVRLTEKGCYVRLNDIDQLLPFIDYLLFYFPQWRQQIHILQLLMPELQTDLAQFQQQQAGLRQQIDKISTLLAYQPPLLFANYAATNVVNDQIEQDEQQAMLPSCYWSDTYVWFISQYQHDQQWVFTERQSMSSMTDWLNEQTDKQAMRYHQQILLATWQDWLEHMVLAEYQQAHQPVKGILLVGTVFLPLATEVDNLWQRWVYQRLGLRPRNYSCKNLAIAQLSSDRLFPDGLVNLLSSPPLYAGYYRLLRYAMLLLVGFAALSLLCSAYNNYRFIQQLTHDLHQYHVTRGKSGPVDLHLINQQRWQLRWDLSLLEQYQQQGVPSQLGLGLYQAALFQQPIEQALLIPLPIKPKVAIAAPTAQTLRLTSLALFDSGKAQLKAGADRVLQPALQRILANPVGLILIAGHTDNTGNQHVNQRLSLARAQTVKIWLKQQTHFPERCFAVQGYGAANPIASNQTLTGRAENRRVEITLVPTSISVCQTTATH